MLLIWLSEKKKSFGKELSYHNSLLVEKTNALE